MRTDAAIAAFISGSLPADYVKVGRHKTEPLVILKYTDRCTDDQAWNEITRQCRGLILNAETGEVVALPMEKFFNIGEMPETQPDRLPNEPFTVFEKVDGSLLIGYRNSQGELSLSSSGSFDTPESRLGNQLLRQIARRNEIPSELTPLFELLSPRFKEVVNYGQKEELVLLSLINRQTGEESAWSQVEVWAEKLGVRTPKVYEFNSLDELMTKAKTLPVDLEGFVIRFQSGLRVKLKGKGYLEQLKINRGINYKKIFAAVVSGTLDSYLVPVPEELRPHIQNVADEIVSHTMAYEQAAREIFTQAPKDLDKKGFWAWVEKNVPSKFQTVMFFLKNGKKEPDWFDLAEKNKEGEKNEKKKRNYRGVSFLWGASPGRL